jgi:hypothetical protein
MLPVPSAFVTGLFLTVLVIVGAWLVIYTLLSAARSIVLPRSEQVALNGVVFGVTRWLIHQVARRQSTFAARDHIMALTGPLGLLALPVVWLSMVSAGYTMLYYAAGVRDWGRAYDISGSALLTLGPPLEHVGLVARLLVFSEAALGLLLVALLITYLPTIYSAFTRRESLVVKLELRAGLPLSAAGLIGWLHETDGLASPVAAGGGTHVWEQWEMWFMDIEESHTSLPVLSFFRSREPGRSWVTAAATILDTAAVIHTCVDTPRDPHRELCLKAGVLALNRIARFFEERNSDQPLTTHQAVVFEEEHFQVMYAQLVAAGVLMQLPPAEGWLAFNELRGRYHEALMCLAHLTRAPVALPR